MQGTLAVVSQSGQSVSFFDLATLERTTQLNDITAEPHELCLDSQRNVLYVSHAYRHGHFWVHGDYSHEISIIDCATKKIVGIIDTAPARGPHGLVIDRQRDVLYASVEEIEEGKDGGLISIDLKTRKVMRSIGSHSKPHWFVMTPDGGKAYTCNKTQSFISVLDLDEGILSEKIDVPSCEEPGISPDGRFAYFPTPGFPFGASLADPSIQVVETATDKITRSVPIDLGAQAVHVTSLGTIMVGKYSFAPPEPGATLPKATAGRLALYSAGMNELLGEVEVGVLPLTMRSTPDGKTGFVANILSGTVTVVDLTSMAVIKTLDVDTTPNPAKNSHQGAHGMAILP